MPISRALSVSASWVVGNRSGMAVLLDHTQSVRAFFQGWAGLSVGDERAILDQDRAVAAGRLQGARAPGDDLVDDVEGGTVGLAPDRVSVAQLQADGGRRQDLGAVDDGEARVLAAIGPALGPAVGRGREGDEPVRRARLRIAGVAPGACQADLDQG